MPPCAWQPLWPHELADEYGTSSARRISRLVSHRETDIQSILPFSAALKDERWWETEMRVAERQNEERNRSDSVTAGG